jgi:hypothetical protein
MMHVIIGLFFIALGVWGVFDEWYYVVDFLKGSGSLVLILGGLLAIFAGAVGPLKKPADEDLAEPHLDDDDIGADGAEQDPPDQSGDDD